MTRGTRDDDSQPTLWVLAGDGTVNTSAAGRELSAFSASPDTPCAGAGPGDVWELVFSERNLDRALRRVVGNGGAPGVDEMTVGELEGWLVVHWPGVRRSLEDGSFRPSPVRRVEIPKPGGGRRVLGVPTVLDRLVQQAICQVLVPVFDPGFSESSYGYRPGRSAHQAVSSAREMVADGLGWVVELDLDRFFDRANHDMVMARVARKVADKRLLRLIRRFLESGVMVDGVRQPVAVGTPQGSPLSPLLSNVLLDDLDSELEARGHRFVRYADDLRVYVGSERAALRVLSSMVAWIETRLRLRVNHDKSRVGRATQIMLLGFGMLMWRGQVRIRVAPEALARMRQRVRRLTSRRWAVSLQTRIDALNRFIAGWVAYFRLADTPTVFRKADQWTRRRLRQALWVAWKNNSTRVRNLYRLGASPGDVYAATGVDGGPWRASNSRALNRALNNSWWTRQGLVSFTDTYNHHQT